MSTPTYCVLQEAFATEHVTYSVEWEVHYCDQINRKDLKGIRRVPSSCILETAVLTAELSSRFLTAEHPDLAPGNLMLDLHWSEYQREKFHVRVGLLRFFPSKLQFHQCSSTLICHQGLIQKSQCEVTHQRWNSLTG